MLESSPSGWTILLALVSAVLGSGLVLGLITLWVNRGKPLAERILVGEQTDRTREETRGLRIQSELSLVKSAMDMVGRVEAELARKDAQIEELEARLAQYDTLAHELKRLKDDRR